MARRRSVSAGGAAVALSLWAAASGCTELSLCSEGLCAANVRSVTDAGGSGGGTSGSSSTQHAGAGGGVTSSASTSAGGSASTSGAGGEGGVSTTAMILALQPNDAPVANVDVVVNGADGTVVLRTLTNDEGSVALSIPQGGSVTIYRRSPSSLDQPVQPLTILSPPDGALIRVPMELVGTAPPSGTSVNVVATGVPVQPVGLTFFGSCGAEALTPATLDFACARAGSHPTTEAIVAVASTLAGVPAAWGSAPSVAVTPGESVDVELTVANTDFASINVTITHVALDAMNAVVELRSLASQLGTSGPIVSHRKTWTHPVGDLGFTAKVPAASWGFRLVEKLAVAAGAASRELWRERRLSTLPSTSELSGLAMPALTLAPLDMSEPAHPRLDWEIASDPLGEITVVTMDFGEAKTSVRWTAWLPPETVGTFRLPEIPQDLKPAALAFGLPPVTSMVACAELEGVDSYPEALSTGAAAWVLGQDEAAGSFMATAGVLKSVP